jgi:ribosomal protein L11 methylase PrmA
MSEASSSSQGESKRWFAIDVKLESEAREAVEYALMEAGALGTESKDKDDREISFAHNH